jgi:hypothetical protein
METDLVIHPVYAGVSVFTLFGLVVVVLER